LVSETRISELIAQQIAAQTTPNAEVQQAEDTRKLVREEIARLLRARRLGRHQAES